MQRHNPGSVVWDFGWKQLSKCWLLQGHMRKSGVGHSEGESLDEGEKGDPKEKCILKTPFWGGPFLRRSYSSTGLCWATPAGAQGGITPWLRNGVGWQISTSMGSYVGGWSWLWYIMWRVVLIIIYYVDLDYNILCWGWSWFWCIMWRVVLIICRILMSSLEGKERVSESKI